MTLGHALFVGSGDSLAAGLLAERYGHRAASAGDVAWTAAVPPGFDTVVGISQSGRTAATVRAVEIAATAGLHTVAITANGEGPLAAAADETVVVEVPDVEEELPTAGYLAAALAVLALVGDADGPARIEAPALPAGLPSRAPAAISVLTLPDLRSAGDLWMLKLIEATGVATRSVPLEEAGHVDYFVGPQEHLSIHLVGEHGADRHARLADALRNNGHTVITVATEGCGSSTELTVAILGAAVAAEAARLWDRPPFRGHAVPMDARHIQLPT